MGYTDREQWHRHYADGRGFRRLGEREAALLAEHCAAPAEGGRALDVGCGTGELAVHLASLGYAVDAVDFAAGAITRAREEHPGAGEVNWCRLDIERDDPAELGVQGYDLITLRLVYAFLHDRTRVLHGLGQRLRPGGAVVVVTPLDEHTPEERRDISLGEEEIGLLTAGWGRADRFDADGLAFLVLRGPCPADTRAVERRHPPAGPAATAALAVVTDGAGRVLLGRSRHGVWELPGGKTEGAESFEAAAVRELAEETGLAASVEDAYAVTMLADDSHGVPRLTAVVRITGWSGTLANPEARLFGRWEWHDLHGLACVGEVFAPAAQALDAVWPGVIPGLPPVHAYPLDTVRPPVPGEPAEAVRLRRAMADAVVAGGWARSEPVRQALRTVPRHRFAPETALRTAYDDDLAVVTRRDEAGRATSSLSAAWLQADMIESLRLRPGSIVFEAGSGGYNAELLAHVVGPGGRVVSGDVDPYVVRRTRRLMAEAGSGRVTPFHGDAARGAPSALVPRGGFDGSVITYNVWDVAPSWREQLAEGGLLVLPLEIHGYTRAVALQRTGDVLVARGFTACGFVRAQGAHARTAPVADLLGGEVRLRFDDGPPLPVQGLEEALRGPRRALATGVTVGGGEDFGSLQLYAATTLAGFCRLAVGRGRGGDGGDRGGGVVDIPTGGDAAALLGDASLAYLTLVRIQGRDDGPSAAAARRWEFVVHSFGEGGDRLAKELAGAVRAWERHVRDDEGAHLGGDDGDGDAPVLTVHPAGTPDHRLPAGDVLDKTFSRLVFRWPGRENARAARPTGSGPPASSR